MVGRRPGSAPSATLTERSAWEADELLHSLGAKAAGACACGRSSIQGETEFGFAHALTRDVAYSQIRRADRAQKHESAAAWIERLGGGRDDKAELLADHYATALDLRRQLGEEPGQLTRKAATALAEAGRQSAALNAHARAVGYFDSALSVLPANDHLRPNVLAERVVALTRAGAADDEVLQEALEAQVAAERWEAAARIEVLLGHRATREVGDLARGLRHLDNAARYAELFPYSHTTTEIAHTRLRALVTESTGEHDVVALSREALEHARAAGDEAGSALLLWDLGDALLEAGDMHGLEETERAAGLLDRMSHRAAATAYNSLGWTYFNSGQLAESVAALARAADWARRLAEPYLLATVEGSEAEVEYYAGSWERATTLAERYVDDPARFHSVTARNIRGRLALASGDIETALSDARENVDFGRSASNHEFLCPGLVLQAAAQLAAGEASAADDSIAQYFETWRGAGGSTPPALAELAVLLARPDRLDNVAEAADMLDEAIRWRAPILALADGRYAEAANLFGELAAGPLAAEAHLLSARQAWADGQEVDARRHEHAVRVFADRVGSAHLLRELDALRESETA